MLHATARDLKFLSSVGITHIVNAAHGAHHIDTGAEFYSELSIKYHGVEASDSRDFDITPFLYDAARFIHDALSQHGVKVLVHCARGVSRSAVLVLAYLMIHENLPLTDAIKAICNHRNILPNPGFLQQLIQLESDLNLQDRRDLKQ
ncbi:hypothetical protein DNTS_027182 [Danionella cerebrum]|uniref:Dual specificity protein phosphatase n=1 Tax=Danionella cerebrum TaxID=2873325 RepID=A0A553N2X3_9TELE|nr:hypothetical protein DNTS_027182 [Danionella translucida]